MTRTYINAHIATPMKRKPTKTQLRQQANLGALHDEVLVSDTPFHYGDGVEFTLRDAISDYGPHVGVELNHDGQFVAMIEADSTGATTGEMIAVSIR